VDEVTVGALRGTPDTALRKMLDVPEDALIFSHAEIRAELDRREALGA
jgi:hypothetical protein